ncbi:hypothetical protein HDU82_003485, partial [Entophlyctis luteolus]
DNWQHLLPVAQFAYNNSMHSSTGVTPFMANQGWNPRFSILTPAETVNLAAETRAQELQELHATLVKELHHTQEMISTMLTPRGYQA